MPRITRSRAADVGLLAALALAAAIAIIFAGRGHSPHAARTAALSLAAAVIAIAALAVRGRHAFAVLVALAIIALATSDGAATVLPLLVATFNVALRCERRAVAAGAFVSLGGLLGSFAIHSAVIDNYQPFLSRAVAAGLAIAAGLYLAARRAYIASLQDRASQLEREQQLLTDHAVADERVRIARELHDVVAHGVSLMVVQAQALGALEGAERDEAGARIATVGREALTEMHRMLGVLRPPSDEGPELAPAPGIGDVASLIARARDTGLDVALAVEGEPRPLPAGVDLSAYRIVQEALTNVVRHSRARRTDVSVRYALDALELTVVDDGAGAVDDDAGEDNGAGHGLVGMRERVALFGGTLETGRARAGGWSVRAVLPL